MSGRATCVTLGPMDSLDLSNLIPLWRSGRTRDGRQLTPEFAEGMRYAAQDLEAVLRHRYTMGAEVRVLENGREGEITGAFRETRRHPIMYVVALTGGGDFIGTRDELQLIVPRKVSLNELDPQDPASANEVWRPEWAKTHR